MSKDKAKGEYDTFVVSINSGDGLNLPLSNASALQLVFQAPLTGIVGYRIKDVSIPQTFHTINSTYPLTFGLTGNVTGALNFVVPSGNYSYSQLALYIQTQYKTVSGNNISVQFINPQFRTNITLLAGSVDATISITATELALNGMSKLLGYYSTIAATTLLVASNAFNLTGPIKILVNSAALNKGDNMISYSANFTGNDGMIIRSNCIWAQYLYGAGGDITNAIIPSIAYMFRQPERLTQIDLSLTNQDNIAINLNGWSWGITLEFLRLKDQ